MPTDDTNGWKRHEMMVLDQLKHHSDQLDCINAQISAIRVDIAMLKVKSGAWGLLGGMVPILIFLVSKWISEGH